MQQKNILRRFLRYLKPFKTTILLAMSFALVVSLCDLGRMQVLADTLDSLKSLENFNQSEQPTTISFFVIDNIFEGFEFTLTSTGDAIRFYIRLLLGVIGLVFVMGLFVFGTDFLMERVGNKLSLGLRNDLYAKIVSAPLGVLSESRSGDVMSRITDDVRTWQQAVAATSSIMQAVIKVIAFITFMLYKSIEMTIFSLLVLPLMAYIISRIGTRVRKTSTEIQQRSSDIFSQLKETLTGINIIKSFTTEKTEMDRFQSVTSSQYRAAIRRARYAVLLPPVIEWMAAIGSAIVFGLGCWQVIEGELSIGWFTSIVVMVALLYKPIKTIGTLNNVLQQSLASAERIFVILDMKNERTSLSEGKTKLTDLQGTVEFINVTFAYDKHPVIRNVSFKAEAGQMIALVGPSGSGKTTLLNLLQRFYAIDSGAILIDNVSIDDVTLNSLRQNIALVPQDSFLFDGTVLENIGYGSPDSSRQQIVDAAIKANAHDFITKMPNDYDTHIEEAGSNLSGGEKQRISIARAILKNAPILVLDEATSALDTQSEAIIQESLKNLMKGRTSFIIAHRLSTVQQADKILVISDGQIVERGDHATLLEKDGLYNKMCQQQLFS